MAPGADGIVYNFGTMQQAVASIDATVSKMNGLLSDLDQSLRPLETNAWSSDAQQQYKIRKDQWTNGAADIALLLGKVKQAVESAASNMRATDTRAKGYFES
jgi:WXG100 family type VII secretion target